MIVIWWLYVNENLNWRIKIDKKSTILNASIILQELIFCGIEYWKSLMNFKILH